MNEPTAGGGGTAGQPDLDVTGARPASDDDATSILPAGFVLPEGYTLVHTPPPTLEQAADGAAEHAAMQAGIAAAARRNLARVREQAQARIDAAQDGVDEAEAAAGAAAETAARAAEAIGRPYEPPARDQEG